MRSTVTVKACLHRFCSECIEKSLRVMNNECPSCRAHVSSRRSMRQDVRFDELIATLLPPPDEYDKMQAETLTRAAKLSGEVGERLKANLKLRVSSWFDSLLFSRDPLFPKSKAKSAPRLLQRKKSLLRSEWHAIPSFYLKFIHRHSSMKSFFCYWFIRTKRIQVHWSAQCLVLRFLSHRKRFPNLLPVV